MHACVAMETNIFQTYLLVTLLNQFLHMKLSPGRYILFALLDLALSVIVIILLAFENLQKRVGGVFRYSGRFFFS